MISPMFNTMIYITIGALLYQWSKTTPDWDTFIAQIWFSLTGILMYKLNLWIKGKIE